VLWFLRVQLWLTVLQLVAGLTFLAGSLGTAFSLSNHSYYVLPLLILTLFPRMLAAAMLGAKTRGVVTRLEELRPLVLRCAGAALFVHGIGSVVLSTVSLGYTYFDMRGVSPARPILPYHIWQLIGSCVTFVLGFLLAFGPVIRENFREA